MTHFSIEKRRLAHWMLIAGFAVCASALFGFVGCGQSQPRPSDAMTAKPIQPAIGEKITTLVSPYAAAEFVRDVKFAGFDEAEVVQLSQRSRMMVIVSFDVATPKSEWMGRQVHSPDLWHLAIAVYDQERAAGTPPKQFVLLSRKQESNPDGLPPGGPIEARNSNGEVISLVPTIPDHMAMAAHIWSASYSTPSIPGKYELQIHLFPCADIPTGTGQPFSWGPPVIIHSQSVHVQ